MSVDAAALLSGSPYAARLRCEINPRARRISLRLDVAEGCVVLVRPKRASDAVVARFVAEKRDWIEAHLSNLPERQAICDGATLPIFGEDHVVRAAPTAKRGVWSEAGVIYVSGGPEHMTRRLKDFLKHEARKIFDEWARTYATALNVKVARVAVRDTTSRWGSCTKDGRLSLSWRLIFAPRDVAAYVVAHEVAHLKHMNHSPAFWRTVDTLAHDVLAGETKAARSWLRQHGATLHRMI